MTILFFSVVVVDLRTIVMPPGSTHGITGRLFAARLEGYAEPLFCTGSVAIQPFSPILRGNAANVTDPSASYCRKSPLFERLHGIRYCGGRASSREWAPASSNQPYVPNSLFPSK